MVNHSDNKGPSARSAFICGATALLLAPGCGHDMEQASEEQIQNLIEVHDHGEQYIRPVLEEMAIAAGDGPGSELVFGPDGTPGAQNFIDGIEFSSNNIRRVLDNENVKIFNDPEYIASAFYRDVDVNQGLDLLGINEAFVKIVSVEEMLGQNSGRVVSYSLEIHEGAHEDDETIHSEPVNEWSASQSSYSLDQSAEIVVVDERDFGYLVIFAAEDLEYFFESEVIRGMVHQESWLGGALANADMIEDNVDHLLEYLERIQTPDGWAESRIDEDEFKFLSSWWSIPAQEQRRIIAESGWFEEFLEGDMKEFAIEAKRELGLEFIEKEQIDEIAYQEWLSEQKELMKQWQERNQELDGYAQQEMRGGGKRL
ncbi:hypothetical protein HN358_03485 [Candidatus Uhrbacteria bacterium]|jgi:hypothetical protein|nr:hypothetical protein [Candidatus Uhrbacteria bacterium]MBT7716986.1 hypothetical protein [Candidatus Uhrbacteria bacterium]